jgi:hypothetical protein
LSSLSSTLTSRSGASARTAASAGGSSLAETDWSKCRHLQVEQIGAGDHLPGDDQHLLARRGEPDRTRPTRTHEHLDREVTLQRADLLGDRGL